MKGLEKYDIDILRLENRIHHFEFSGDDSFFKLFDQDILEGGSFKVDLELTKTTDLIRLSLDIHSELKLTCDRSLRPFVGKIYSHEKHIYKYSDKNEEVSEDLDFITYGTPKINIAHLLFDYILLQVPIKKLHPDLESDDDDNDGEIVYSDTINEEEEEQSEKPAVDPRWAALIELKNKKTL